MTEDPDATAGRQIRLPGPALPAEARLGTQAGAGIANALTLIRERSIADALQRGLLAAKPAIPSGLEVAGRCLPTGLARRHHASP